MAENPEKRMRTKQKLTDALVELCEEKHYYDITVWDICNKAQLYRSTFYRYFETKDDMLREIEHKYVKQTQALTRNLGDFRADASEEEMQLFLRELTADMEYQLLGADVWIKGTGETITGLEPGAYLIRYRATDDTIASEALILAIAAYTAPDEIALPVFEPEDGNYFGTLEVSIACATEGAVIRYTTDGTEPDADSPAYTGPIMLGTGDWTIRAVAMADGAPDSEIATAVYHIGYIPCGGEIRVRKALSGRDWTEKDSFEFTVEKSGDAPVTEKGTVLVIS